MFPRLLPGLHLPTEICEKLFCLIHDDGLDISDETAAVFSDPDRSRLRSVSVRDATIGDKGLRYTPIAEILCKGVRSPPSSALMASPSPPPPPSSS